MSVQTESSLFTAVGRRKTATARVRITAGTGKFIVNNRELAEYCYTDQLAKAAIQPIEVAGLSGKLDVTIKVVGGGPVGQSGAIRHGLARAIQKMDPELRAPLKKEGLLTRDGRMKERKKSGQPGARKRFQFSKR